MDAMICICREIDKNTGNIAVYPIRAKVTDRLLFMLNIRQRANPELRYYVALRENYDANEENIIKLLSRRNITEKLIAALKLSEI